MPNLMKKLDLDSIDHAIVAALNTDGRLSNTDLADRVGLSASPCLRRVKRLENAGVLRGYSAIVDRNSVGLGLTVFVEIKVRDHTRENAEVLQERVLAMPEAVNCHMVSGAADFLVEIVVRDLDAYERLLTEKLLTLPISIEVRSNFALRLVKYSGRLPL